MLQPSDITTYQRNSNEAAGYCAACKVKLHPFETHVCDNCAGELAIETNPNGVMHDDQFAQRGQRP